MGWNNAAVNDFKGVEEVCSYFMAMIFLLVALLKEILPPSNQFEYTSADKIV